MLRRVGELQEEDLLAVDRADARRVRAAREDVEAVQAGAERRVVGALDDPPRVVERVDVPAPGERLVGDPHPARGGPLGQLAQLRRRERVVVDRRRRDVRADEDRVRAELLHDRELGLGAGERRLRHRLEVAERLVERDLEAELGGQVAHLGGPQRRADQVVLEQLDGVEAGGRGGAQLLLQRAAQADGGDRAAGHRPASRSGGASGRGRAVVPVKRSKEPAACRTTMPPPSSVRQPAARASRSSSVSSGR